MNTPPTDPYTREPAIGLWQSRCCLEDTYLIESDEDIASILEERKETSVAVFDTFEDAAAYFKEPDHV